MPYRFRKRESVSSAIRRIVREETHKAAAELASVPEGRIKGIHEARKSIKKIRAALRLVQPKLGDHFAPANRAYRDISRQLSGPRDAEAMIECLDRLAASASEPQTDELFKGVRAVLVQRRDAIIQQSAALTDKVADLAKGLDEVRAASEHWVIRPNGFGSIAQGLKRAYRRGRKGMNDAFKARTDGQFHEWRKEVKAHWYHVRLLRGIWPRVMIALANELSTLADLLGDDHDLAVLSDALSGELGTALSDIDLKPILAAIRKRRQQLRRAAHSLAQHLYVEKPNDLRRRFQRYWVIWHRQAKGVGKFEATGPGDQAEPAAPEQPDEAGTDGVAKQSPVVGSIHIVSEALPRSSERVV